MFCAWGLLVTGNRYSHIFSAASARGLAFGSVLGLLGPVSMCCSYWASWNSMFDFQLFLSVAARKKFSLSTCVCLSLSCNVFRAWSHLFLRFSPAVFWGCRLFIYIYIYTYLLGFFSFSSLIVTFFSWSFQIATDQFMCDVSGDDHRSIVYFPCQQVVALRGALSDPVPCDLYSCL